MSAPQWAVPFPAGVADAEGRRALVRDLSGHVLALDLADGAARWRSGEPMLPLLLDDELAIGLALLPPRVVALAIGDGAVRWRSDALPWPAWALKLRSLPASSGLCAGWLEGDVVLQWRLHLPADGGAAHEAQCPVTASGGCRIARAGGAASDLAAPAPAPAVADASGSASLDPTLFAQRVVAGVCYRLRLEPGGATLRGSLSATRLEPETTLWTCDLGETPRRAPAPRRP